MAPRPATDRFAELIRVATGVFIAHGYRRTQMSDVAAALGVAKGTIYLYVESKEALFDAVLRLADSPAPISPPGSLPLRTPAPGETLKELEKRIAEEGSLPALAAALDRKRVSNVQRETESIFREIFALLARHRTAIELIDRCALDHPDLARVWYRSGREGTMGLMESYFADRSRRGLLRVPGDPSVIARIILETLTFWAVHRHWDPSPQDIDEGAVEDTVVRFLVGALVEGRA